VGLATATFTPGVNRLAFGVIDQAGRFVYAPTAVYVAPLAGRSARTAPRARGPFPAPADPLSVPPAFRSRNASIDTTGIRAIYATQVRFPRAGRYAVVVVSHAGGRLLGASAQITVVRATPIPAAGQRPPAIDTPTFASAGGDLSRITTRVPPDDMNRVSFKAVLGRRPVALLFSTPALCQSRVCGPVTDIALSMESAYGARMTFIHQEVYVDNQLNRGLRPQMLAFHLRTEPWLFTVDRRGRVAARLEGAFGIDAFHRAIEAALG
jgi:hypothetical protein